VNRRVICALVALAPARGYADGIAIIGGSPRAIGRAGTATVGDDGGGALLINPAAMARRDTLRVQLGLSVNEDEINWRSDASDAHTSSGQAGSELVPLGAVIGAIGDWILGAGAMRSGVSERQLERPGDVRVPLYDNFDFRYAGIAGSYRRDTLAIGAARRIGDTLALGLSFGVSQVRVAEHRRIWAGFGGVEKIGSPASDVDVEISARDRFTPSAVVGLMYAPEDTSIELGASVAWSGTAQLTGSTTATGSALATMARYASTPTAAMEVRQPVAVRAGGRYVGDRVVGELGGDVWIAPANSESIQWDIAGVELLRPPNRTADLTSLPSRISQHTHVALRTSVDVELIPGFLWATAGYAYANLGTPASHLSPSFGDLGGQTLGLGLETTSGSVTVTLGWSRTWAISTRAPADLRYDNPFPVAGDGPVPSGTYDGSLDQIGILIEADLASSP